MRKLTKRQEKSFTRYLFQKDYVGEGSGRIVYSWRGWVIKVAKNKNGYLQNKNEVIRFKKYGNDKLAEIIAYSKKIVIMEKVNTNMEDLCKVNADKSMKLTNWLDEICEIDSIDHSDSQGLTKDGRLVCYDYGDSKKTYTKKLNYDLTFRELLASEQTERKQDEKKTDKIRE